MVRTKPLARGCPGGQLGSRWLGRTSWGSWDGLCQADMCRHVDPYEIIRQLGATGPPEKHEQLCYQDLTDLCVLLESKQAKLNLFLPT